MADFKNLHAGETLIGSCEALKCEYNERGFCKLTEVILDENGHCIYESKNNEK